MPEGRVGWLLERVDTVVAEVLALLPLRRTDRCTGDPSGPIVSIASYPGRSTCLPKAVRSILRGRVRPAAIVVVLARAQYPDGAPPQLLTLADRGVEVRWVDPDQRSYKKLVPLLQESPERTIVTADDDVSYPTGWLQALTAGAARSPGATVGLRGTRLTLTGSRTAAPYAEWPVTDEQTPAATTFLKGYGGILYPPHCLSPSSVDVETARDLAPSADDVWFKVMALLAGTPAAVVPGPARLPSLLGSQSESLMATNVDGGANDVAVAAVLDAFDAWPLLGPPDEAALA